MENIINQTIWTQNSNVKDFILDSIDQELEDQEIYERTLERFSIQDGSVFANMVVKFIYDGEE